METVVLGRTGLNVSVAGLGCGGRSRLGQRSGASVEDSIGVVHEALDLGITFIDTAQRYETEEIVGRALEGRRDEAVISTKVEIGLPGGGRIDAPGLRRAIEESLGRLRTETVDIFHLHFVRPAEYSYCVEELVPEMLAARDRGEIRYLAISEFFAEDVSHEMLQAAAADDCWDVAIVGFNMLNPSARLSVFPHMIAADVGVEIMYAVRNVFSQPQMLRDAIAGFVAEGLLDPGALDREDPLGFLVRDTGASSIIDAAYRFARHEAGCHVILTGTGDIEHLRANVASINRPALPEEDLARLAALFGDFANFSGD